MDILQEAGWASYKENGTVCGIKLPDGLQESQKLPEPIYTPSTKADLGGHDVRISLFLNRVLKYWREIYPGKGEEYAAKIKGKQPLLYIRNVQNTH